jgi:transposase
MNRSSPPNMSSTKLATALVPRIAGLKLEQIKVEHHYISMTMNMVSPTARCPLCARSANRVHSHYTRTVADLPWGSFIVRLRLHIRKFFCLFSGCPRRIFAERLPELVVPYARRTIRQGEIVRVVGLAVGARAGSRLAKRLQLLVSPSTLLRLLRQTPQPTYATPRVLGVDDFARRKGTTYGTILVDLEKHCPIEMLPTRSAEALAVWLRKHPGIEIITRDRSTEYTRGITEGAPNAVQVADKFHILCNLRDALERVLDHNRAKLGGISLPRETREVDGSIALTGTGTGTGTETGGERGVPVHQAERLLNQHQELHQPAQRSFSELLAHQEHRHRRRQNYEQVHKLYAEGVDIRAIGNQLGICRMTVYRYLRLDVIQPSCSADLCEALLTHTYPTWLSDGMGVATTAGTCGMNYVRWVIPDPAGW